MVEYLGGQVISEVDALSCELLKRVVGWINEAIFEYSWQAMVRSAMKVTRILRTWKHCAQNVMLRNITCWICDQVHSAAAWVHIWKACQEVEH